MTSFDRLFGSCREMVRTKLSAVGAFNQDQSRQMAGWKKLVPEFK